MRKLTGVLVATCVLLLVSGLSADPVNPVVGGTSGDFDNLAGGPYANPVVTTAGNVTTLTYGDPAYGGPRSTLSFTGLDFSEMLSYQAGDDNWQSAEFSLGTLCFSPSLIYSDSDMTSADLVVNVALTDPSDPGGEDFTFGLTFSSLAWSNTDTVTLGTPVPTTSEIDIDDCIYTIDILRWEEWVSACSGGYWQEVTELATSDGCTACARLVGQITAECTETPTGEVPLPSSVVMALVGALGALGMLRKSRGKQHM